MKWYIELFGKYAYVLGVRVLIENALVDRTKNVFPEWFLEASECLDHRQILLKSLVTVLLFKNAKWLAKKTQQENIERLKICKFNKIA